MRASLLFCFVFASGFTLAQPPAPKDKKNPLDQIEGYKRHVIEGFTVLISDETLNADTGKFKRLPLEVLELELKTVARIMPPKALESLRKVLIWVEWDETSTLRNGRDGAAVAVYAGGHQAQMYREGKHPLKAKAITVLKMKELTREHQPERDSGRCVLLHELAHAVHDVVLGLDNPTVKSVYRQAMERKLYDRDQYVSTNDAEFFAELSCAYYDQLHHYPQTREDLKQHDPVTFKFLESVWGKDSKRLEVNKARLLAETNGASEFDLTVKVDKFVVGERLLGPAFDANARPTGVLVVGFFGGPDKAVLSRYTALHNEMGGFGVRVVAGPAFVADREVVKQDAESREVPFTVVDRLLVPVKERNGSFSQPPGHTLVFNASGECVFRGSGYQVAPHIRAAVWNAILTKTNPPELKGLAPLTTAMKAGAPLAEVLAKTVAAVLSGDTGLAGAARPILNELTAPGKAQLDEALAQEKTNPLVAFLLAESVSSVYKGTKLAGQAQDLIEKLKTTPIVSSELKARPLLEQIVKLDAALMTEPGASDPKAPPFLRQHSKQFGPMKAALAQLRQKHPNTKATEAAEKIAQKYGV